MCGRVASGERPDTPESEVRELEANTDLPPERVVLSRPSLLTTTTTTTTIYKEEKREVDITRKVSRLAGALARALAKDP